MEIDVSRLLIVGGVILFVLVAIVLILTILIQRPQGGGISGAFGSGAGSGQTAFGTKTGDALTIATISMFVIFLALAIGLNFAVRPPEITGTSTPTASGTSTDTATPAAATSEPVATTDGLTGTVNVVDDAAPSGDGEPPEAAPADAVPAAAEPQATEPQAAEPQAADPAGTEPMDAEPVDPAPAADVVPPGNGSSR